MTEASQSKRFYKSVNVAPSEHKRLQSLADRFTKQERSRTQPVSIPETIKRLLDFYDDNEAKQ